jgi:hypothetical protein
MLNRCFLSGTGEGCDDDGLELDASRRSMDDGFGSSTGNGSRISSKDRAMASCTSRTSRWWPTTARCCGQGSLTHGRCSGRRPFVKKKHGRWPQQELRRLLWDQQYRRRTSRIISLFCCGVSFVVVGMSLFTLRLTNRRSFLCYCGAFSVVVRMSLLLFVLCLSLMLWCFLCCGGDVPFCSLSVASLCCCGAFSVVVGMSLLLFV